MTKLIRSIASICTWSGARGVQVLARNRPPSGPETQPLTHVHERHDARTSGRQRDRGRLLPG